jgi:mannose-6-phosphate isomerase-like protein (cupin superfamily)
LEGFYEFYRTLWRKHLKQKAGLRMERTHKSWGEKWNLHINDLNEVSVLYLQPNQRCSWHKHQTKFNRFFVIQGSLYIKTESGVAEVKEHEIFTTRPGEMHEFQTHDSGAIVMEIMYVKYDPEDIQRETIGGNLNG